MVTARAGAAVAGYRGNRWERRGVGTVRNFCVTRSEGLVLLHLSGPR